MSPISPTPEQYINDIVNQHYPNDVTYHHVYNPSYDVYLISCDLCQQYGLSWFYNLPSPSLHGDFEGYPWASHLFHALTEHALKHNDLVKRITDTFYFTPKYPHGTLDLTHLIDKESEPKKSNKYRRIELDEEKT